MTREELATLVGIVAEAAELVRSIYERPFAVAYKGPRDPVTEADTAANELICGRIQTAFPGDAIVAEESDPRTFRDYRSSERIFFVDPVDGTREFVDKNGDFVVMLGVVEGDRAVAAVVTAPVTGVSWVGLVGYGAFRLGADGSRTPIFVTETTELSRARIVSSRSHRTDRLERALAALGAAEIFSRGSAGLKGASVANGEADAYIAPHYAGKRWDVCPADALVVAAGGRVTDALGHEIDYRGPSLANDQGVIVSNGRLHDRIVERLAVARGSEA